MSFQTPVTIQYMIQGIQANRYVLPAIQREFVWKAGQIERLFDSLMRGYPIGSFLFWQIASENVDKFQFYKFMDKYHERDFRHNEPIELVGSQPVTAILDGQQRLTALNIGLRGTYADKLPYYHWNNSLGFPERKLYLNLFSAFGDSAESGFEFRMLRKSDVAMPQEDKYWYLVNDIFKLKGIHEAFDFCIERALVKPGDKRATTNLSSLWWLVHEKPIINYYLEEGQDLDKVLNIFIRVNSGGTTLSYSDMLLSIATAQWKEKDARKEINELVDALNQIGEGFQFTRDFVLKSALVLTDLQAIEFKVSNFTRDNMLLIEQRWDEISHSLRLAVTLLASWGYSWQTLPSNNAIIPIAYHLKQLGNPSKFHESINYKTDRDTIRRWLAVALLKRAFSGQSDTTLRTIRQVLQTEHGSFPVEAIADALKQTHPMYFAKPELDGLLAYHYGQNYTFIVLSMLYPWLKFDQHFHLDHIYPKGLFTAHKLTQRGIPHERHHEWIDHVNDLANLQLLQGLPNQEKSDQEFEKWLEGSTTGQPDMQHYMQSHMIPMDVDLAFDNFPAFLAAREQLIRKHLADLLDVRLDAPVPEFSVEMLTEG